STFFFSPPVLLTKRQQRRDSFWHLNSNAAPASLFLTISLFALLFLFLLYLHLLLFSFSLFSFSAISLFLTHGFCKLNPWYSLGLASSPLTLPWKPTRLRQAKDARIRRKNDDKNLKADLSLSPSAFRGGGDHVSSPVPSL